MDSTIIVKRYNDKVYGDIKDAGFSSQFKSAPSEFKFYGYLNTNGIEKEAWVTYYNENRRGRTDLVKLTTKPYMYYRLLKIDKKNKNNLEYYYCLPRGFTQTHLLNLELDYNTIYDTTGKQYSFSTISKISKAIGVAEVKPVE